jgi:valyl-tRNA synthetase
MDEERYESVIQVFLDLYKAGKIYRGFRMVNWDPDAQTTVSDEEVIHKDVNQKLYYLQYAIEGEEGQFVTIATTRPETIMGDTAVCVNPNDERFSHLIGKRVVVPIANRSIPVIGDDYVDMEFGTGCLKITPAHDVNDKEIGDRHKLEVIDILNDNGTLNAHGLHYEGQDRFAVRKAIAKELEELDALTKTEDYATSVGTSERTGSVIEPKLSVQWFLSMKELSEPALKAVMEDVIQLVPEKFKNTYRHWMENVRDWNISRQLYWGHRIPAWYYGTELDEFVVAKNEEEALQLAIEKSGKTLTAVDLKQDEDVLDTWFSSWLWPISVFDGIRNPDNEEVNYYYPTATLVTAPEILFFWVARMIIAGYFYRNEKPFDTVYLTGIVRDKQGRKMSKSLGNSPDPIQLMEKYGADGVRVGMLLTSPAGNDLPFDESLCEQGRNFINKIWNALRLVNMWEVDDTIPQPEVAQLAAEWFDAKLSKTVAEIEDLFSKFRISEALMTTYKLVWDDFCSWYLELIKPGYQQPIDAKTKAQAVQHFEQIIKLLHPFMPFLTEEIWHELGKRAEGDCLIVANWPADLAANDALVSDFDKAVEAITNIRTFRAKQNIPNKDQLTVFVKENEAINKTLDVAISKLTNLEELSYVDEQPDGAYSFVVGSNEYFIPLAGTIDLDAEREKLTAEIEYTKGFLNSVMKKLSNERFVNNAPEQVVAAERKKQSDAEAKIKVLEEQLSSLG